MERRRITPSQLRSDVYRILDEVLETGRPYEVIRKGKKVILMPESEDMWGRMAALGRRKIMACSFDELVETSWDYHPEAGLTEVRKKPE